MAFYKRQSTITKSLLKVCKKRKKKKERKFREEQGIAWLAGELFSCILQHPAKSKVIVQFIRILA